MSEPSAAAYNASKTMLVFGAHPDDIEIGMAGTISRLTACGNQVYSCIATIPAEREARLREARAAAAILGIKDVILLPIKTTQFGYNRNSIGAIDAVIKQFRPHSVFTHWIEDSLQDHVNVTRCIVSATRKNSFNVYMYEQTIPGGITPAGFRAQYLIDVSQHIDRKMQSIHAHASQLERNGSWWLEGVRGRAMYRGYQIHTQYAEAFEIIKINDDTNLFSGETASALHAAGTAETAARVSEKPTPASV